MHSHLPRACSALLLSLISSCAGSSFDVRAEPTWQRSQHHFSTFAVQRDGLMSREGWRALGPNMPAPFGSQHCEVAFGQAMFESAPELANAVDSYVRSNGLTDTLLERFASAADGHTIMFVALSGAPRSAADGPNTIGMPSGRGGGGRGGRRGGGGGGGRRGGKPGSEVHEVSEGLQIDATFYSVRERRSLAAIRMNYTGTRIDEAVREFNDRLDREFPGARCSGWKLTQEIDPVAIRGLPE